MKFRFIENQRLTRSTKPAKIRFNPKGILTFNAKAIERTGLKDGERIMLAQDIDKPNDFYLIKAELDHFPTLRKCGGGKSLTCNYRSSYDDICKHFLIKTGESLDINIGGGIKTEFGTAYVLITAPLIEIKRIAEKEVSNG